MEYIKEETQIKFIKGEWGFDKWDEFIDNIYNLGDVSYAADPNLSSMPLIL